MGIESFFGIGGPEFFFILILAGIFLGPGRIAKVARWLGQTTAKLQLISRGFMTQLRSELDMAEGQEDLRDMLKEMQDLRAEVNNLQSQLGASLKEATADTEESLNELKNSIAPPTLDLNETDDETTEEVAEVENSIMPPTLNGNGSPNGSASPSEKSNGAATPKLPKPIQIEDDPS